MKQKLFLAVTFVTKETDPYVTIGSKEEIKAHDH